MRVLLVRQKASPCIPVARMAASDVAAGFPSPAEDLGDQVIDLNAKLIHNPPATFFVRVRGESMTGAGIFSGDVLIVDRSLDARDGNVVVARLDGDFTVKRLRREGKRLFLVAENPDYATIEVGEDRGFEVWGVVTYAIRSFCRA